MISFPTNEQFYSETRKSPKRRLPTRFFMERATGIEPAWSAWEAEILPLNHARIGKSL